MANDLQILGAGGGGKGGGDSGGHESDDTLFSNAYIELVEIIGEGQIGGLLNGAQSIYLNDTPVLAADGSRNHRLTWGYRSGHQAQELFESVQSVASVETINTKVQKNTPIVATITDEEADSAIVTIGFPRLMKVDDKGNINGTKVEFKIELQSSGGSYESVVKAIKTSAGTYDAVNGYFESPDNTTSAEVYIRNAVGGEVWVEHSTNGVDWTPLAATLTLQEPAGWEWWRKGFGGSVSIDLPQGINYLRWEGVGDFGNSVQWTYVDSVDSVTVGGKNMSKYQKQYRFNLAGDAPWSVRVTRVTDDSISAKLSNDIYFDLLTTEIKSKLNYPNTALMYYRITAKEFSSVPSRKVLVRLLKVKVPTNYDPETRVYDGVWDGTFKTAWTDNPAWCFYDLCTKERYGLGRFISSADIDKWGLYQIGQYCDELVDSGLRDDSDAVIYEPRFRLNVHITEAFDAFSLLKSMASVFRGMMYVLGGVLTAVADQPADPVMLFNQANVIGGRFEFSGSAGLARKTVALVEWRDPSDLYQKKVAYVPDRAGILRYGINPTNVAAFGCTSEGQAYRLGKWILLDAEVVSFSVGLDAARVKPGDVIKCAIPLRNKAKRYGGRLKAVDGVSVTLDAPVTLSAGHAYQLSVALSDSGFDTQDVATMAGTTDVLTLSAPLSGDVVNKAIWVLSDSTDPTVSLWRVIGVNQATDGITATITALSYDPDKYAEIDSFADVINTTKMPSFNPLAIAAPASMTIESEPYTDLNNITQNRVYVHWAQVDDADGYSVRWRINDGNWHKTPTLRGTVYEMDINVDGLYEFEVVAISPLGKRSPAIIASAELTGDSSPLNFDAQWTD